MKFFLWATLLTFTSVLITSCSGKLAPLSSSLFNATPSPLEVVGTKIPVTVSGKFPEKWFNKNAVVTITPVLRYEGGERYGTAQTFQGENVAGNGVVVPYGSGSNFSIKSEFAYTPELQKSELYLTFVAKVGKKSFNLPDVKVADGVVSTVTWASALSSTPADAPDQFQRIIKEAHDANIMFLIQQAELRSSELNSSSLAAWKRMVEEADANERKYVNIEVSAYASPDGGMKINEPLAEKREKNTTSYLEKELRKAKVDTEINARYTAQDWDGFRQLVEASNLQDKALVLRVLEMYQDPEQREHEIKNISLVFSELAETILPKLRRSRLTANIEIVGKTDEELVFAVTSNRMGDLSIEELLYAANLQGTSKEVIYNYVTQKYPSDYRAWNNLGAYYFANKNYDKATAAFDKALALSPKGAEPNMNLALTALADNNLVKAQQLLGNASQANTINEALGLFYLKNGEYQKAVTAFGDANTDNAAVAQIVSNNYSKAQQVLDAVENKTATTYYLGAIVAARTNNVSGVASNLRQALIRDASIKKVARTDIELSKFLTNPDIANILR